MSDLHMRILRLVARRAQRELDEHDAGEHARDAVSTARRQDLAHIATRARTRVVDAQARRRDHRTESAS